MTAGRSSSSSSSSSLACAWALALFALLDGPARGATPATAPATRPHAAAPPVNDCVVDANLPDYRKTTDVSGALHATGSSTVCNMLERWADGFRRIHPDFQLDMHSGGSAGATPALIEGKSDIAPISRPMNAKERDAFAAKFGYPPVGIKVGIDAIAIYVNRDNPLKGLTLAQVDSIFSSTRKRGGEPVSSWGQLGVTGPLADRRIRPHGYASTGAGAYAIFREIALDGGDYSAEVIGEPVSSSVVQAPGADDAAIAYASRFLRTQRTRVVPVSTDGATYFEPTPDNALSGEYPLARFLFVYVNVKPGQPLEPRAAEFLRFCLSRQGQEMVAKDGNFPLNANIASEGIAALHP